MAPKKGTRKPDRHSIGTCEVCGKPAYKRRRIAVIPEGAKPSARRYELRALCYRDYMRHYLHDSLANRARRLSDREIEQGIGLKTKGKRSGEITAWINARREIQGLAPVSRHTVRRRIMLEEPYDQDE
jgi:hypothetical protein